MGVVVGVGGAGAGAGRSRLRLGCMAGVCGRSAAAPSPCSVPSRPEPTRCCPPCAARRTTCSDTSTLTQWGNSAHPREFGASDASLETLSTLRQGYAREGECTPSGVAAAAYGAVQHVLRQTGQGQGPGQRQDQAAAIQPLLGARCPLFARKFLPSAAAAWTQLLRPVVKP